MKKVLLLLPVVLLMALPVLAAQKLPPPATATAKCPVCGMFVAKYPDWTGVLVFKDGATAYFDGPKDLFSYYLDPGRYERHRKRGDIADLYVKDYYSLKLTDARRAYYVIGSDLFGPMGKELVPFARKDDAESFLNDHRGKRVLGFGEITPEALKSLE
jgi:copper chaperone NosL